MKKPYLIQRGTLIEERKGTVGGIDELITFDYMGSSEFENSALPRALNSLIDNVDHLQIYHTTLKSVLGQGLFVLCHKEHHVQVLEFIHGMYFDIYNLKEYSYLARSLNIASTRTSFNKINFWWDIQNDYMFCLGKDNCKNLLKGIKAVKRKRS